MVFVGGRRRTREKIKRNHRHAGRPKPTRNANQRKRANETTAERTKPKATQKAKPQPTPNLRPLHEALDSIDWGAPPPAGSSMVKPSEHFCGGCY